MQKRKGLREQKRQYVLDTVHQAAVALFTKHGYDTVTIEDIAQASGVSRSTIFRHFATKEAIVLHDSFDPILLDSFRSQPSSLTTIQALRNMFHEVVAKPTSDREKKLHQQRYDLIRAVPQLRTAMLQELAETASVLTELIAERTERPAEDISVRTLASALVGVAMGIVFGPVNDGDYLAQFDQALKRLEAGLTI